MSKPRINAPLRATLQSHVARLEQLWREMMDAEAEGDVDGPALAYVAASNRLREIRRGS